MALMMVEMMVDLKAAKSVEMMDMSVVASLVL